MITTNRNVARRWANGQTARNHNGVFTTDGNRLFSYNQLVGITTSNGTKVLLDYTAKTGNFLSMTTSGKHISPARGFADLVVNPTVVQNLETFNPKPF
tara:strand:- start:1257 stop:1550 length:294 start_codon:yes stop_codon:yes gene_type:complete